MENNLCKQFQSNINQFKTLDQIYVRLGQRKGFEFSHLFQFRIAWSILLLPKQTPQN